MNENMVRCGLVQAHAAPTKDETIKRQVELINVAADRGAKIIALQELCNGPYFCQEQSPDWFEYAEQIPDGPTVQRMIEVAADRGVVLVVPIFERDGHNYYNSAAFIDAGGKYLGTYRKLHIPHTLNFYEKFYFRPGNLGMPVFDTAYARIGALICYDRHFPEAARMLGLAGAQIVFIPTATAGVTKPLWMIESRAHAIVNGYFVGSINRVGVEQLNDIDFYGSSYFCDPWGNVLEQGSEDQDEVVIADIDLAKARPQFYYYRDRRPETYGPVVAP